MISPLVLIRPGRQVTLVETDTARERSVRRRVTWAFALLTVNVLTWAPGLTILKIPSSGGKVLTQGALQGALLLALSVNPRVRIRPNVFLFLVSLLLVGAAIGTEQASTLGSYYRVARLAEFIIALWILSPWFGRKDLLLVRTYLITLSIALSLTVVGYFVAHHRAMYNGRLNGVIYPIPDPQVGHYAAVVCGMIAVMWFAGLMRGRTALMIVMVSAAVLVLTHTRTALVGMAAGIVVAGLSLFGVKSRVRKFFAGAAIVLSVAVTTLAGVLTAWLARGESGSELTNLSGRTKVWSAILSSPRTGFEEIFGLGLSNSSFNGLSIDSNWLASYQTQGLYGVTVCAIILLYLLIACYFQPRGARRALALFLVTYSLIASVTEVGFTDATTYMLELALAASLLVPSFGGQESDLTLAPGVPVRPARKLPGPARQRPFRPGASGEPPPPGTPRESMQPSLPS